MTSEERSLELEIAVRGTPEEVWRAIATGPGISSWYVPHTIEERTNGAATASFGEGPEMQVNGRVAAWEPPHRFVVDGGEGVPGLAFEWLVEAKSGDTCIVRLVNSGFGSGAEWDDHYVGMAEGWKLFLENLRLHLEHFSGQTAVASLPMATWKGPQEAAFARLTAGLGLSVEFAAGDRIEIGGDGVPRLTGTVTQRRPGSVSLLVDLPAPGTAFFAAEKDGASIQVSVWSYLYGEDGSSAAARDGEVWQKWLSDRAVEPTDSS